MAAVDRERWVKLVADFESSDLSQREFSNERGISFSILRYWIYQLRREARPLAAEETAVTDQAEAAPKKRRLTLKPVRVVASAAEPRTGEALLELALPSGTRVRFPAGTDLGYLRALAAAL
jgi:transposase-like protein